MAKYLQIQIPKACHENWDKMDAAMQGKFCNSCQKNVIDFTLMTDDNLINFFKKNKGNVCGRFTSDQLNTYIPIPAKKIPWLRYFFQAILPAFFFYHKANAQTSILKGKVACTEAPPKLSGDVKIDIGKAEITNIAKGEIIDEKGNPIPGTSITIKNKNEGVVADTSGKFTIELSPANRIVIISGAGLIEQEVDFTNDNYRKIIMRSSVKSLTPVIITAGQTYRTTIMGAMSYIKVTSYETSPTASHTDKKPFSLYPNPARPSSRVYIKWKTTLNSVQSIQLYDQSGRLLQHEMISVDKSKEQSFQLNRLPAGAYIIKITDSKTHKFSAQQFIVE